MFRDYVDFVEQGHENSKRQCSDDEESDEAMQAKKQRPD